MSQSNVIKLFPDPDPDFDPDLKEAWLQQAQKIRRTIYALQDFRKNAEVYSLRMTEVNKYTDSQIQARLHPSYAEIKRDRHFYLAIADIAKLRSRY